MMAKLLLADDSVTIQRVIELTFADEKIQVIAVGDGHQAIQRIDAERPDVVLADVGMPERDGYEVAAHVKRTPHLAHIPVLLLTGAFEPIDEARARAVGCDGVLVKPFEPQMVINRVKDLLAGRRPQSLWQGEPVGGPPADAPPPAAAPPAAPEPARPTDALDEYFDRLDAAFAQHEPPGRPPAPAPKPPAPPSAGAAPGAATPAPMSAADYGEWDVPADRTAQPLPTLEPHAAPVAAAPGAAAPAPAAATAGTLQTPVSVQARVGSVDLPKASPSGAPPPAAAQGPAQTVEAPAAAARAEAPAARPIDPNLPQAVEGSVAAAAEGPALAEAFAALLAAEEGLGVRVAAPAAGANGSVSEEVVEEVVRRAIARMSDQVVRQTVLQVAERLVREEIDRVKKGAS